MSANTAKARPIPPIGPAARAPQWYPAAALPAQRVISTANTPAPQRYSVPWRGSGVTASECGEREFSRAVLLVMPPSIRVGGADCKSSALDFGWLCPIGEKWRTVDEIWRPVDVDERPADGDRRPIGGDGGGGGVRHT